MARFGISCSSMAQQPFTVLMGGMFVMTSGCAELAEVGKCLAVLLKSVVRGLQEVTEGSSARGPEDYGRQSKGLRGYILTVLVCSSRAIFLGEWNAPWWTMWSRQSTWLGLRMSSSGRCIHCSDTTLRLYFCSGSAWWIRAWCAACCWVSIFRSSFRIRHGCGERIAAFCWLLLVAVQRFSVAGGGSFVKRSRAPRQMVGCRPASLASGVGKPGWRVGGLRVCWTVIMLT
mmetsp:Transcript_1679/g.3787  ORF Transcript_1679/g.3787 Transcript_1679/m.3787 type:complete len:230 (-) Transcript_1679:44-733(-)